MTHTHQNLGPMSFFLCFSIVGPLMAIYSFAGHKFLSSTKFSKFYIKHFRKIISSGNWTLNIILLCWFSSEPLSRTATLQLLDLKSTKIETGTELKIENPKFLAMWLDLWIQTMDLKSFILTQILWENH